MNESDATRWDCSGAAAQKDERPGAPKYVYHERGSSVPGRCNRGHLRSLVAPVRRRRTSGDPDLATSAGNPGDARPGYGARLLHLAPSREEQAANVNGG